MARRSHSSIDRLPADIREDMLRMVVDGQWPADYEPTCQGNPRYDDVVAYVLSCGHNVARSSVARWAKKLQAASLMKDRNELVRSIVSEAAEDNAGDVQRVAVDLITSVALDALLNQKLKPKEIGELARCFKDAASVSVQVDKHNKQQIAQKAKAADAAITDLAAKKQLDTETLKIIREQVYGIFSEDKK